MNERVQIDGNSEEYEAFVAKFKAKHSSDDTFTPPNVYETVRDWAVRRYGIAPGTAVVRPFWPGGDYTRADYPDGCVVIDNPPFSILAKIVGWYNERGIRFFLFAPGLTSLAMCRDGRTAFVSVHVSLTFENGAKVDCSFVTNMEPPDVLAVTASDLFDALDAINAANEKRHKRTVTKLAMPSELVTAANLGYLTVHHTPFTVRRSDATFCRKLDNYATGVFGGGFLLSPRAAAERAAAERAAAKRIELSERERALITHHPSTSTSSLHLPSTPPCKTTRTPCKTLRAQKMTVDPSRP